MLFLGTLRGLAANPQSATDDLWDLKQGAVVTGSSSVNGGFDARDFLGGSFGNIAAGQGIFADNQPTSFVHYLEWQTPAPVMIGGFVVFAEGDGAAFNNQREFAQFVLKAKSSPAAPDYDLTLFSYDVPSHPYDFVDPINRIVILTNIAPVTAAAFRAEFVQYPSGSGFDGPRVWELDGYQTFAPIVTVQPTNKAVTVQANIAVNAKAVGLPPLFYQWSFNGTNLDGATNAALTLNHVQFSQAGTYAVAVSNLYGTTNSLDAVVTVNPAPPCIPAPPGLISWWRAEDSALDQVSGNHGTLVGNATFGVGELGQGFVLDGSGDLVSVGNPANLQTQDFTIESWIQRASPTIVTYSASGSASIFGYGFGGYALGILNDGRLFLTKVGLSNVTLTNGVTDTDWHQVVVTKTGSTVIFYIDGAAFPVPAYDPSFNFGTGAAIGARADNQDGCFFGTIDEVSFYSRALTPAEIQTAYGAGLSGKCLDSVPPTIVSQPRNTTVLVGGNLTLTVAAGGSPTLAYQWRFNGANLGAATNTSLVVSNVQFTNIGVYSVVVSNPAGSVVSSNATLTVTFPPATARIGSTNAIAGGSVVVPLLLAANGNENAFGFSLNFSTQRLAFASATLGSGAAGATLLLNTSMTFTGRIGAAIVLPYPANLAPGTQEVLRVTFNSLPLLGVSSANTTISFADQPVARELTDAQLQTLSANYSSGILTLAPSVFESDVSPRTNGNQNVSTTDWLQVGRFVARLDVPASTNEFQRADCAPLASRGEGQLKVTDWVQAGRFLAGFDPLAVIGGAISESAPTFAGTSGARRLSALNVSLPPGGTALVSVALDSLGDENALGFTLAFDPLAFTFSSVELGSGAAGAVFLPNLSQAGSGKVGIALALGTGSKFSAGSHEVAKVNLLATAASGDFPVTFSDQIVTRCVSDAQASELPVGLVNGPISITSTNPSPTLAIASAGGGVVLSWPVWAGDFTLQTVDALGGVSGGWTNASGPWQTTGGNIQVLLSATNQTKFFLLRR